jgi:uncharacterized repeat protein (TIGR01451 family)
MKFLSTAVFVLFLSFAYSQDTTKTPLRPPLGIQWVQTLGTSGYDYAEGIKALPDGGYIICGVAGSNDGDFPATDSVYHGFVSRYDQNSGLLWTKLFPLDDFFVVDLATDGDIIVLGDNRVNDDHFEPCLLKLGLDGTLRWRKIFEKPTDDFIRSMLATADGGAVISIEAYADEVVGGTAVERGRPRLVKVNSAGDIQWDKVYSDTMRISALAHSWNGSRYAFVGNSVAYDTSDYEISLGPVLGYFDLNGNIAGYKRFNYALQDVQFRGLAVNKDSSIITVGAGYSLLAGQFDPGAHGNYDALLQKFDKSGKPIWHKWLGGTGYDYGNSVISTDSAYFLGCETMSVNGNLGPGINNNRYDAWLVKTDSSGKLIWQQRIGGSEHDFLQGLAILSNQDIVVIGDTESAYSGDIHENKGSTDFFMARIGLANTITGSVFLDTNNDGIQNTGEKLMDGFVVKSSKGTITRSSTTINGWFRHAVDTGTYITSVNLNPVYFKTTPLADTFSFANREMVDTIHFALQAVGNKKDLRVALIPQTPARPGFSASYRLLYKNAGNAIMLLDTVQFIKDPRQTYGAIVPAANTTSGDTLRWFISSLNPLDSGSCTISVTNFAPPALNNNDTLILKASISPISGDETPADNIASIKQLVIGSYDPNDKTEMHAGYISPDQIGANDFLTYLIRFQNTGTDTAFNVHVRDTLDNRLDWNTFEMIAASHPHILSITDQNKLNWSFNNILLPDSNVNEPKSHGYLAYRIKPKSDLQIGDSVKNTASIYFDFNLPVVTNTSHTVVYVTVVTPVSDVNRLPFKISIFPNPSNGMALIKMDGKINGPLSWRMVNMNGAVVMSRNYGVVNRNGFNQDIDLRNLAKGIYFLTVNNGKKSETLKIVVQ